ncbi:unnamed protein product [Boreogadus saida]
MVVLWIKTLYDPSLVRVSGCESLNGGKAGVKLTITSREQPEASWIHLSGERPGRWIMIVSTLLCFNSHFM